MPFSERVAPDAIAKLPVCVPPLGRLSVPASTSTVPELLKATLENVLVWLASLVNVPALLNTLVPDAPVTFWLILVFAVKLPLF